MLKLNEKQALILDEEKKFARSVAGLVIEKPKLSIWMILIPIIFVHYFYRWNQYSEGLRKFSEDFVRTRQAALEETSAALAAKRNADAEKLVAQAKLPAEATGAYTGWIKILLEHYSDLLSADGATFGELVRSAYRTKENYLLHLNSLNESEKRFDAALVLSMADTTQGVNEIVAKMEKSCLNLRRQKAESIFS